MMKVWNVLLSRLLFGWELFLLVLIWIPGISFVLFIVSGHSIQLKIVQMLTTSLLIPWIVRKFAPHCFFTWVRSLFYKMWSSNDSSEWLRRSVVCNRILDRKTNKESLIIGLHPHGRWPVSLAYMVCHPVLDSIPLLVATGTYFMPSTSFLMSLLGPRKVSDATRSNFVRLLSHGSRAVILVPGGAKETFLSDCHSKEINIFTGHEGFLRIAMQERSNLVPAFAFSTPREFESKIGVRIDQWIWNNLKFPLNFIVKGRETIVPKGNERWLLLGEPIRAQDFNDIDLLKKAYYGELERVFDLHKGRVSGFESYKLRFIEQEQDGEGRVSESLNPSNYFLIIGILYVLIEIRSIFMEGDWWFFMIGPKVYFSFRIMLQLHAVVALMYWVIAYVQVFLTSKRIQHVQPSRVWRRAHQILGYGALLLWFLVVAPTGIVLTLSDNNITGWYFVQACVMVNFMESLWETSRLLIRAMNVHRSLSNDLQKRTELHGARMLRALATSQSIVLPRFLILISQSLGIFDKNPWGHELLYSVASAIGVFITALITAKHIRSGQRSFVWTAMRWMGWCLIPLSWKLNLKEMIRILN